jgi:segregation and condensation protein B
MIDVDPLAIKPIVEALIFASDEPLSARSLIKLLAGENARPSDRVPPLLRMIEEAAPEGDDLQQGADVEAGADVEDEPVTELEVTGSEVTGPEVERSDDELPGESSADEPEHDEDPVEDQSEILPMVDTLPVELHESHDNDSGGPVIDHMRRGGISLILEETEIEESDEPGIEEEPDTGVAVDDLAGAMVHANRRTGKRNAASESDANDHRYIRRIIEQLNDEYDETNRSFRIVEVAGGFQFATLREYGEYVALLSKEKNRRRLSPAALETLAIIAYRQPVSKPEIEAIRGVNCDQVLLNLMEKNLAVITGRADAVGRPLLYGTTDDFLRSFGLNNISDLPKLREIEDLMETDELTAESTQVLMIDEGTDIEEIEARVGAMGHIHHEVRTSEENAVTGEPENEQETVPEILSDEEHPASDEPDEDREPAEEELS